MNLAALDREFSLFIRSRSGWTCARCGGDFEGAKELLHCSHYFSRHNKSVRFDPDNCDALCWQCHAYFDSHKTDYATWKEIRLGWQKFAALQQRASGIIKLDTRQVRVFIRKMMHQAA